MSYRGSEDYCFDGRDRALIASAEAFLRKVVSASFLRPAEMVSVAKVLHVLSRLPKTTSTELNVSISVVSPRRRFGEVVTYHWWEVGVEGDELSIGSGGHFYQPSTGGDTFTTMSWTAEPGEPPDFADFRGDLAVVPDVQSFPDAIGSIDFGTGDYKLEITDPDNPLLEDAADSDDSEADEDSSDEKERDGEASWSIEPQDIAEQKLAAVVKPSEVESNEAQYAYDIEHCDVCGESLTGRALFVDGALRGQASWANMCAQCFLSNGAGVGWGSGQLYAKQSNGDWRMVAGFNPSVPSEETSDC